MHRFDNIFPRNYVISRQFPSEKLAIHFMLKADLLHFTVTIINVSHSFVRSFVNCFPYIQCRCMGRFRNNQHIALCKSYFIFVYYRQLTHCKNESLNVRLQWRGVTSKCKELVISSHFMLFFYPFCYTNFWEIQNRYCLQLWKTHEYIIILILDTALLVLSGFQAKKTTIFIFQTIS